MKNSTLLKMAFLAFIMLCSTNTFGQTTVDVVSACGLTTNGETITSSISLDNYISCTGAKNDCSYPPRMYSESLRFYCDASNGNGSSLTLTANGATITAIDITKASDSDSPTMSYNANGTTGTMSTSGSSDYSISGLNTSSISIQNANTIDNYKLYATNIIVTYTITSGVTSAKEKTTTISAVDGNIVFSATEGEKVQVFNNIGQILINTISKEGKNTLVMSTKGIVIVKVGNKTAKIVL